jgi:hypothetical protein
MIDHCYFCLLIVLPFTSRLSQHTQQTGEMNEAAKEEKKNNRGSSQAMNSQVHLLNLVSSVYIVYT